VKKDPVQPRPAISAHLKAAERLPSLQINLLHHVFSTPPISQHPHGGAEEILEMGLALSMVDTSMFVSQLDPSEVRKSGSVPFDSTNRICVCAAEIVQPWSGWWQVAQVRPFVPSG
jgi:hypothetical protein